MVGSKWSVPSWARVCGARWHGCRGPLCLTPWMTNEVLFQGLSVTSHTYIITPTSSPSCCAPKVGRVHRSASFRGASVQAELMRF